MGVTKGTYVDNQPPTAPAVQPKVSAYVSDRLRAAIDTMQRALNEATHRVSTAKNDVDAITAYNRAIIWGLANANSQVDSALSEIRDQLSSAKRSQNQETEGK
jgi:hypothetical protein